MPRASKRNFHQLSKRSKKRFKRTEDSLSSVLPLDAALLKLLAQRACSWAQIVQVLSIPPHDHGRTKKIMAQFQRQGLLIQMERGDYRLSKNTHLFDGMLQVHKSSGAHLLLKEAPDLYIAEENMGRALHGDYVLARLIEGSFSGSRSYIRKKREGEVLAILERSKKPIVGVFEQSKNFSYLRVDDPRLRHHLHLRGEMLGARSGDKVLALLEDWEDPHPAPEGRIIEVLGPSQDPEVSMLSIIRKHQLPLQFPEKVLAEIAENPRIRDAVDYSDREDLRDRPIFTIDPQEARDFDDAIEVQPSGDGWDVSIHIADVAHYVLPGTALDEEARCRGNSVYLVDRVIPMLPECLSNGLCSLKPQEDRLTFSLFASISAQGAIKHVRFARSVIRSIARLTYQEALSMLEHPADNFLSKQVHTAWACASTLRRRRFQEGALHLEMPEVKIWLDEKGTPIRLERLENDQSHQLIEEFMLLANELVAHQLIIARQPSLYRVHEKPDPLKLQEYRELILSYGWKVGDLTKQRELQQFLRSLSGTTLELPLKIGLLKSLKRARYAPEPLGHFGLQKSSYTHFTSPIRRYADLITHRALAKQLKITASGPLSRDLGKLGDHLSLTERVAADAEKESQQLKKFEYFQAQEHQKEKKPFQAQVLHVRHHGLFVELPDALVSGLIPINSFHDDDYFFEPATKRLVGRRRKKIYRAGDLLQVVVKNVDRFKQHIDFIPFTKE